MINPQTIAASTITAGGFIAVETAVREGVFAQDTLTVGGVFAIGVTLIKIIDKRLQKSQDDRDLDRRAIDALNRERIKELEERERALADKLVETLERKVDVLIASLKTQLREEN